MAKASLKAVRAKCLKRKTGKYLVNELRRYNLSIADVKITAFDMQSGEYLDTIQEGQSEKITIYLDKHMNPYQYNVQFD